MNFLSCLTYEVGIKIGSAWNEVIRKAQPITIPPDTIVIHKDTACQNFLLLSEGSMRVRQISQSGREIVLYRRGPGDISNLV